MTVVDGVEGDRFRLPRRSDVCLPLSFPATTTGAVVVAGDVVLFWWSFTESTGAASAQLQVIDGADATGQELATITLQANESVREGVGNRGLYCTRGVFVRVLSGSVRGTVGVTDV